MALNRKQLIGVALLCLVAAFPLGFYLGEPAYRPLLDFVAPPESRGELGAASTAGDVKAVAIFSILLGALCLVCMGALWATRGCLVHPVARTILLLGPMLVAMAVAAGATRLLVWAFTSGGPPIKDAMLNLNLTSVHLESVPLVGIIVLLLGWRSVRSRSARRRAAQRAEAP